jgi:N-acetylmuramoyl-L-alanine amidase
MGIIPYNGEDVKLLERLIRAKTEGKLGMFMVGSVGGNRNRVRCLDFKDVDAIRKCSFKFHYFYSPAQSAYPNVCR